MAESTSQSLVIPESDGFWINAGNYARAIYWGIHLACFAALWTGVNSTAITLFLITFWVRMWAITGGYHRYFSHRTYKTSRAFQFLLGVLGTSATQKGPLWWAGHHRAHHRHSDGPGDRHSPNKGFWYSHQGWIFDHQWDQTPGEEVPDLARYPELVWLNKYHFIPPLLLAVLCFVIGGWPGLVWGYVISTTLLWHSTYTINSLAHVWGTRRYDTGDDSRNNWFLALLTMGEGWHNNHHRYMASTRQGFFWWEVDATYYILRGLAAIGVVRDLREPPASILKPEAAELPKAA